ncbi:MAG: sporulation protein YunB [Bacilli bacterium]
MTLKRKNKRNNILFLMLLIITLVIILSFMLINYCSKKAYPILKSYAEAETKKLTILIINKAVTKQLYNMDVEELFKVTYNKDGEIILIDFDTKKTSKILSNMTSLVELNMRAVEEGKIDMLELPENSLSNYNMDLLSKKIICEIPFGLVTGSNLLANVGPKIPVKISLVGDVSTNFSTEVVEYGINNALLKVMINIKVTTKVILPISSEELTIDANIPIGMKVIQGKIPNYYLNGFTTKSNIVEGK